MPGPQLWWFFSLLSLLRVLTAVPQPRAYYQQHRVMSDRRRSPSVDVGSVEPRPRRLSSLQEPPGGAGGIEFSIPLQDNPPSRSVSHTPPLPPTTSSQGGGQATFDPLEDFSQDMSNLEATDRCLAAACSLLQFEIAEVIPVQYISNGKGVAIFW